MPELPEVDTIRLTLASKIIGLKIKNVNILSPKSFIGDPKELQGNKVLNIIRRGKVLGINLSSSLRGAKRRGNPLTLLFHFKMSGQLIRVDSLSSPLNSHTRVIFTLSDNSKLYFNDQRRFGWVKLVRTSELEEINYGLSLKMGPEPLEKNFNWKTLRQNLLKHPKTPVKVALMDPVVVVGVGNIYASEACFNARLDPRTLVSKLSDNNFKSIYKGVVKALKSGLKHGGATKTHFVDADGNKGYFLDYANVYDRYKEHCRRCGGVIQKIRLGGRGTFFCSNCQK